MRRCLILREKFWRISDHKAMMGSSGVILEAEWPTCCMGTWQAQAMHGRDRHSLYRNLTLGSIANPRGFHCPHEDCVCEERCLR